MKKKWVLFPVILLVLAGMVMTGCPATDDDKKVDPGTAWTRSLQPFSFKLLDNFQYDDGYQGVLNKAFLFQGEKVKIGDTYTLQITFSASRNFEQKMSVGIVDATAAANYWKPLTWTGDDDMTTHANFANITAGTPISVTLSFTAVADATSANVDANGIVFTTKGEGNKPTAGSGVLGPITLQFTQFVLSKGAGGTLDVEPPAATTPFGDAIKVTLDGTPTTVNGNKQQGWLINTLMSDIAESTYFVIATEGVGDNVNGFGGITIVYQGNNGDPATITVDWTEVDLVSDGWIGFPRAENKKVYIVVSLNDLFGVDKTNILACTGWARIIVAYYPDSGTAFEGLGVKNAYFIGNFTKPAGAVNLKENLGYIFSVD